MDVITSDQLEGTSIPSTHLVPVLQKIFVFAQLPDDLEERKRWLDVYKSLCSLLPELAKEPS